LILGEVDPTKGLYRGVSFSQPLRDSPVWKPNSINHGDMPAAYLGGVIIEDAQPF
jgi:hypothetical protein